MWTEGVNRWCLSPVPCLLHSGDAARVEGKRLVEDVGAGEHAVHRRDAGRVEGHRMVECVSLSERMIHAPDLARVEIKWLVEDKSVGEHCHHRCDLAGVKAEWAVESLHVVEPAKRRQETRTVNTLARADEASSDKHKLMDREIASSTLAGRHVAHVMDVADVPPGKVLVEAARAGRATLMEVWCVEGRGEECSLSPRLTWREVQASRTCG